MKTTNLCHTLLGLTLVLQIAACSSSHKDSAGYAECGATSTEDFSDYIQPGWQSASPTLQMMLITSDPQPFRVTDGTTTRISETAWHSKFSSAFKSFIRYLRYGNYHVPLIINGDMSEHGHDDQWAGYERRSFRTAIKDMGHRDGPLMLPGLGNHDYQNTVGACAVNGCARDSVCDHITWVKAIKEKSTGVKFDYTFSKDAYGRSVYSGSLAYSLDIGNVHVVQLNMEPTYTVQFTSGTSQVFNITQSMDWLETDLAEASARGQYTIINMHRWDWQDASQHTRFLEMIRKYNVVGMFLGHIHSYPGYSGRAGNVPIFYAGVLDGRYYSRLLFDWTQKRLQVNWYEYGVELGQYRYSLETLDVLPEPPPPATVDMTVYQKKNFEGPTCTGQVTVGKPFTLCGSHQNVAGMSLKVQGFGGNHRTLCIKNPWQGFRCYYGTYRGDFEIPAFDAPRALPPGLARSALGQDQGYTWISYEEESSPAPGQTHAP